MCSIITVLAQYWERVLAQHWWPLLCQYWMTVLADYRENYRAVNLNARNYGEKYLDIKKLWRDRLGHRKLWYNRHGHRQILRDRPGHWELCTPAVGRPIRRNVAEKLKSVSSSKKIDLNPQGTDYKKVTFRADMGWPNPATLIGCLLGRNSSITTIFF